MATKGYGSLSTPGPEVPMKPPPAYGVALAAAPEAQPAAWHDCTWAALFLANCAVLVALAAGFHSEHVLGVESGGVVNALVLAVPISLICAGLIQWSLSRTPFLLIQASLLLPVAISAAMGIFAALMGAMIPALLCFVGAVGSVCWFFAVQRRVPVAACMLQISTKILSAWPSTVGAVACFGAMVLYVLLWSVAAACSLRQLFQHPHSEAHHQLRDYSAVLGLAFSLYWGVQVIANTLFVTAAGVVGSWWAGSSTHNPSSKVLHRALTRSFGSICLASLLVALLQALKALLEAVRSEARGSSSGRQDFVLCCLDCLLGCVLSAARFFSKYALVLVALDGDGFAQSACEVLSLLQSSGIELLVADDLIGTALYLCCAAAVLLGSGLLWVGAHAQLVSEPVALCAGLSMAAHTSLLLVTPLEASTAAVFVLFAQRPAELAGSHPEDYRALVAAWRARHPEPALSQLQGLAVQPPWCEP